MSISPSVQILNYWVKSIGAALENDPSAVPDRPKDLVGDGIEGVEPDTAVLCMCNAVQTVLRSERDQQQVSNQTYLKVYSLAQDVLSSIHGSKQVESKIHQFLNTYYDEKISKIDPFFYLKHLLSVKADFYKVNELRTLEVILFQMMNEKICLNNILVYELLDLCKNFYMQEAEKLGALWKADKRTGVITMDWEKIPSMSPEEIAICSRLELAQKDDTLGTVLKSLLEERLSLDEGSNRVLDIWQSILISQSISKMQLRYYDLIQGIGDDGDQAVLQQYSKKAIALVREKEGSFEQKKIAAHYENPAEPSDIDVLFRFLASHLREVSLCAMALRPSMVQSSSLYEQAFALYSKAIKHQKGYRILSAPVTPDEFKHWTFPAFRSPDEIILSLKDPATLERLSSVEPRIFCEAILRTACPGDDAFISCTLDMLFSPKSALSSYERECLPASEPASKSRSMAGGRIQPPQKKRAEQKTAQQVHQAAKKIQGKKPKSKEKEKGAIEIEEGARAPIPEVPPSPKPPSVVTPKEQGGMRSRVKQLQVPPQKIKLYVGVESLCDAMSTLSIADSEDSAPQMDPAPSPQQKGCPISAPEPKAVAAAAAMQQGPLRGNKGLRTNSGNVYSLAERPILHERVETWVAISKGAKDLSPEDIDSVIYHTYPILIARIIQANIPALPFTSPATRKVNQSHSCVGSIHRFGENLPIVIGSFQECFDKKTLYHHFFKPSRQRDLIASYRNSGGSFDRDGDTQAPPRVKIAQGADQQEEPEGQFGYEIRERRFSLTLIDHKVGIAYTLAFPSPMKKDETP